MSVSHEDNYTGVFDGKVGFGRNPAVVVIDFTLAYTTPGSPFFAEVAGARFDGALMLDLREEPHVQLWLGAADVDVGNVLRQLKLARDVEAGFGRFTLYLDSHSGQLSGLLANAKLVGEITGGKNGAA